MSMLGLTVTVPKEAEAVGPTVLATISWNPGQDIQEAEVKPGEHGTVLFTGVVNCDLVAGGTFQKVVVDLSATSEQGWSPTVNPPKITYSPNTDTDVPFSVTVTVPSETSFYITDTIQVSGKGVAFPGIFQDLIDPVSATIKIKQFYKFSLGCGKSYQEVGPTERLLYNVRIFNLGNARDTYHISIKNLEQLSKKGFTVTLEMDTVEIEAKNEATVGLPVGTPIKFNFWLNEIQSIIIEVKSEQEERNEGLTIPREFPLTVRQRGFSTPGFDPIFVIIAFAGLAVIINIKRTKNQKWRRRY